MRESDLNILQKKYQEMPSQVALITSQPYLAFLIIIFSAFNEGTQCWPLRALCGLL